ncbi:GNAT family N-acetyltransferase [Curtobacterium sp. ISL-83]|uniref:GNAT family N-acetyltransferase n=1 Tax=Curtobacterium sp. ISL-83 TaxID=2819145 RepID=UPI001BE6790E|nr:GNAT family protein [Curtobacterium sp. ISL-83]MBT2502049.1 GNAT family N-acetyltransferase [Curtobacterium sp. ISL-83]
MSVIAERLAAQPTLTTERLTLVQLGPEHLDASFAALDDLDAMRLTGTRGTFTRERVRAHLERLPGAGDRADFAITDRSGAYLGEVVLNELEEDDLAMNYRIALAGPSLRGRGYGTEAGRAVVDWGFDVVGLHRISLEVYAFNPAAQRSYAKIGFVVEGRARDALRWDGEWVDAVRMAMLDSDPRPR